MITMAGPGRRPKNDTEDPSILRRRQQTALRVQNLRRRKQQQAAHAPTRPTLDSAEENQINQVLSTPFAPEDAAIALIQLAQPIDSADEHNNPNHLAADPRDTEPSPDDIVIDEHIALYQNSIPVYTCSPPQAVPSANTTTFSRASYTHSPARPTSSAISSITKSSIIEPRHRTLPSEESDYVQGLIDNEDDYNDNDDDRGSRPQQGIEDSDSDTITVQPNPHHRSTSRSTNPTPSTRSYNGHGSGPEDRLSTVDKLYMRLCEGFHGCTDEKHAQESYKHEQDHEDHYSLNETFNEPNFPTVLNEPEFLSPRDLETQPRPSPAHWKSMFCGIKDDSSFPHHVCLQKEKTKVLAAQVSYDIDSFLGFADSLCFARQGLHYQPAPMRVQNMQTDVHIKSTVFRDIDPQPASPPRPALSMLKDIPHFHFGRVEGGNHIALYILFPHLDNNDRTFTALSKPQYSRWMDQIFHPAVYHVCEAHVTQHLSTSYERALATSRARQVEGRRLESASYQAQQALVYYLKPEYLASIWDRILEIINTTPGLHDFRAPQLFFAAKGTKLQFKSTPSKPTLLDVQQHFDDYLNGVLDLDHVDLERLYIDIGKETCPRVSQLRHQPLATDDEAQVYLWKKCCLRSYIQWLYDGDRCNPPKINSKTQRYYAHVMLRDACSLTSVTPSKSQLRQDGLIYSQFYNSTKEIGDAARCTPFANSALEDLALDQTVRDALTNITKHPRRSLAILEHAYRASKSRIRYGLLDSIHKSFGLREEDRISWYLFQNIAIRQTQNASDHGGLSLDACPSYAWGITSQVYLDFLWRSADKFATGFEMVRALHGRRLISWEHTKIMSMFLRCLRYLFNGEQLSGESPLWWSRRDHTTARPSRYGLGFCNTLPKYGYCWLEPRIDWERLTFYSDITEHVLFGNHMLRGLYLQERGQAQDYIEYHRRSDMILDWLDRHVQHPVVCKTLLDWMVYICLRQFRVDILHTIKREIPEPNRGEVLRGTTSWSHEVLTEIMGEKIPLVSGNRVNIKQPILLAHYLFDFGDHHQRGHWENRPYRKLYQHIYTRLREQFSEHSFPQRFAARLRRLLFRHHWILPLPTSYAFILKKNNRRRWYSIRPHSQLATLSITSLSVEDWKWAAKSWRPGRPPKFPSYLDRSYHDWQDWLDRNAGPRAGFASDRESSPTATGLADELAEQTNAPVADEQPAAILDTVMVDALKDESCRVEPDDEIHFMTDNEYQEALRKAPTITIPIDVIPSAREQRNVARTFKKHRPNPRLFFTKGEDEGFDSD